MGYIFHSYITDNRWLRSHKTFFFFRQRSRRTADVPGKLNSSLVLIYHRTTCDTVAGTAGDTVPTYENRTPSATTTIAGLCRRRACEVDLRSTSQARQRFFCSTGENKPAIVGDVRAENVAHNSLRPNGGCFSAIFFNSPGHVQGTSVPPLRCTWDENSRQPATTAQDIAGRSVA